MKRTILLLACTALLVVGGPRHASGGEVDLAPRILSVMLRLSPPERHRPPPGWEETDEAARARYAAIARDIAAVARSRVEAGALTGIAWHESGYARDVDEGPCYAGKGYRGRCDSGRAVSLWQLQGGDSDLYRTDRRAAATEARRRIAHSRKTCAGNDLAERLAVYAGGRCDTDAAKKAARGLDAAVRKALEMM